MRRGASLYRIGGCVLGALAMLVTTGLLGSAEAERRSESDRAEAVVARIPREPFMAIVSLGSQRVTVYDAEGSILHARVSSGRPGYETPAGIFSVLQKEREHNSNLYDDAEMPFMQRLTWSGIALHAGALPGYPASHGCIRMPRGFAEELYDLTKIGMRVIVTRSDVRPVAIAHPALFAPPLPRRGPGEIAAEKAAEAKAAAQRANRARLAAARLAGEAARIVPVALSGVRRAEAELAAAESMRAAAHSPAIVASAEERIARARARLAEAEAQRITAEMEAPIKAAAAEQAREAARAAEAERIAAVEASREATRTMAPVSVFISRRTERLYVRQAFQEVLESPVTIRDAAVPIGTHVYTALDAADGGSGLRWNVVSLREPADLRQARRGLDDTASPSLSVSSAAEAALDRIEIPQDVVDRLAELISPGASVIVSDEAMSSETGKDTDFVILMSGEPQGAIAKHRPTPQARGRDGDARTSRRAVSAPRPFYWDDPYSRW